MKHNSDTYRSVKDSFWTDILVLDLLPEEKLFYLWLFTNSHLDPCGCYQVTNRTIEYETGLSLDVIVGLIERFIALGRIDYNEQHKEFILLKWKNNNQGFFKAGNANSIKAIRQGASKIFTNKFRDIVLEWLGDTIAPSEAPTLAPTLAPRTQPLTINSKPITLEPKEESKSSSPPLITKTADGDLVQEKKAVTTTKLSIFEFRLLYEQATNELMPPGLNNRACELCRLYPKALISTAFESAAAHGGKTLAYVEAVLKGKPKGVLSENQKPRGQPGVREMEREAILEKNAEACRRFAEG